MCKNDYYPVTKDLTIAACYAELARIDRHMRALYDDPMTEAYGAPTDYFADDADRKRRSVLARIARRARAVGDKAALEFCGDFAGRWMP